MGNWFFNVSEENNDDYDLESGPRPNYLTPPQSIFLAHSPPRLPRILSYQHREITDKEIIKRLFILQTRPCTPSELADNICSICHREIEIDCVKIKKCKCATVYHKKCIMPWISTGGSCPTCRAEWSPDDSYSFGRKKRRRSRRSKRSKRSKRSRKSKRS
jgi:hypothetical protein